MSIQVSPDLYYREIGLIVLAFVVLVFVAVLRTNQNLGVRVNPVGRRRTDLFAKVERNRPGKKISDYSCQNFSYFSFPAKGICGNRWYTSLSTTKLVFHSQKPHDFLCASNSIELESKISSIVKKIYNMHRRDFESRSPIVIVTTKEDEPSYTWMKHDSHWRTLSLQFLAECLEISSVLDLYPSLEIGKGSQFYLCVYWNVEAKRELEKIFEHKFHDHLSWIVRSDLIGLKLTIAQSLSQMKNNALEIEKKEAPFLMKEAS